jgi:addiction module HigA family antidote
MLCSEIAMGNTRFELTTSTEFALVGRQAMRMTWRLPTIIKDKIMLKYAANFPIAVHPGDILQEMLDERGITQVRLAKHLKTDVARVNEICRRRRGISAQMALMLGKAFGTSAELWMNLQKNWELSQVDQRAARHLRPLRASA